MAKTLDLIYSKSQLVEKISKVSKVDFMVGDRKEDMDAGTKVKARTVFVSWGAQSDVQVDFYISSPQQLLKILK